MHHVCRDNVTVGVPLLLRIYFHFCGSTYYLKIYFSFATNNKLNGKFKLKLIKIVIIRIRLKNVFRLFSKLF